jgi:hypothetical protein
MCFTRISALTLVAALMLVPAVGRARQRVDPPNAKRLSAPYRSVDVRPAPTLAAPDTSTAARAAVDPDAAGQHVDLADGPALPAAPDASDRGSLRGPPSR